MKKSTGAIPEKRRELMAIMFTDIVGYTAMMQQDEKKGINIRSLEYLENKNIHIIDQRV